MHELAITQSILEIALKAAGEQKASRIRVISLVMGPFSGVVPECVQMYLDVLAKELNVMDSTATSLCKDNNIPIIVFNLHKQGNIDRVLRGEHVGTIVS